MIQTMKKNGCTCGDLPTRKLLSKFLKKATKRLHTLNCSIEPRGLPRDLNQTRLTEISQLSLMVVVVAGADARKAVPCHSCRSVAHSVAKDWGPKLDDPAELTEIPHGAAFEWARQRKAFLKASGF